MGEVSHYAPSLDLAFDMRGGRKQAKVACGRPLDGRLGRTAKPSQARRASFKATPRLTCR